METVSVHPHSMPRLPLAFAVGMALAALLLVTGARLAGFNPLAEISRSATIESRLIRFSTDPAGGVTVVDATTGETIASAGKEGFVPGVLRGLNRLRMTGAASPGAAYRLDLLEDGQLLLVDTVSGVALDLNAYGHANAKVFAAFLQERGDRS